MELNSLLVEILKCQVCWEPLRRPIYRCRFEHLLCQACYPKLSHCPSCRERLEPNVRCLVMEQLADAVQVPCMYSDVGCPEQLQLKTSRRHEVHCDFRPDAKVATCPLVYSCHWLGSRADVERHVSVDHQEKHVSIFNRQTLKLVLDSPYHAVASNIYILKMDSALFVVRAGNFTVAKFTSHYVHVGHVAQGLRAAERRYSFEVRVVPNGPSYKGRVTDYRDPLHELATAGGCLFFVQKAEERHVIYSVTIEKLL